MAQANDSILVTPGAGATVATHLVNSKEYQAMVLCGEGGHIIGSKDTYYFVLPSQVHVAAANTVHLDLFDSRTVFIRLHPTADCHIIVGTSPTATTNHMPMLADSTEYFGVQAGMRLAVIAA